MEWWEAAPGGRSIRRLGLRRPCRRGEGPDEEGGWGRGEGLGKGLGWGMGWVGGRAPDDVLHTGGLTDEERNLQAAPGERGCKGGMSQGWGWRCG